VGAARVTALVEAIKQIQLTKKYLQLNSVEVKSSIHSTISRLLESLRSREVWLLNQADVIVQAKEEVLRTQEDRLNQGLGGLVNCLQLLDNGAASEEDLARILDRISSLETHPQETPHLTFRADSMRLRDEMMGFGRVDSKGLPLEAFAGSRAESAAASLPKQFEDYEDEDHQVLYKTVGEMQQGSSIIFNIPQLSAVKLLTPPNPPGRQTSWDPKSAGGNPPTLKSSQSTGILQGYMEREMGGCRSTSSSIRQWLSDMNVDDGEEDGLTTSESKIGELASSGDCVPGQREDLSSQLRDEKSMQFEAFRRICQRPLSDWLIKACALIDSKELQTKNLQQNTGLKRI
jgi:hypothetical protein